MSVSSSLPVTHIRPGARAVSFTLNEVWQARELLYFLVWRDIKVRYKQTVLGIGWSVLQPFLAMVVFTIFFGRLAKMPSDGVPYPLFSLAALVPWTYFAAAALERLDVARRQSASAGEGVFPARARAACSRVDAGGGSRGRRSRCCSVLMAWYHVMPTAAALLLPLYVALGVSTAFAVTLWTSALSVRYRDARYVLPFIIQIWLFVTPVAYPASLVPERWRLLYALNPMASRRRRLQERAAGNGRSRLDGRRRSRRVAAALASARRTSGPSKDRLWISPDVRRRDSHPRPWQALRHRRARRTARHAARSDRGGGDAPVPPPCARRFRASRRRFWALKDVTHEIHAWRRGRRHRRQWRGQVDAAEDAVADHHAHRRRSRHLRPRRIAARGRHRFSSRPHRPREHLPQRRDPRHAQGRDRAEVRRDRRASRRSRSSSTRR